jgi:hypothetical protein
MSPKNILTARKVSTKVLDTVLLTNVNSYCSAYGKKRYQFVLARVLFASLTYEDPLSKLTSVLYFYKDGTLAQEGPANSLLDTWAQTPWSADFNVAFWQIYASAAHLRALSNEYTFTYDAGFPGVLRAAWGQPRHN